MAKDTKDFIFREARRLFADRGYHGVTTKMIAEACDIPTASIHYHFKTKENLYRCVLRSYGQKNLEMTKNILKAPENKEDFKTRFKLYLDVMMDLFLDDSESFRIVCREAEIPDTEFFNEFDEVYNQFNLQLFSFFESAHKAKFFQNKVDITFMVQTFWAVTGQQIKMDEILGKLTGQTLRDEKVKRKWKDEFLEFFFYRFGI